MKKVIILMFLATIAIQNVYAQSWSLTGNAGTTLPANFIGTTDNVGFSVRTNNTERISINNLGQIGIGFPASTDNKLTVNGNLNLLANRVYKIGNSEVLKIAGTALCIGGSGSTSNTGYDNIFVGGGSGSSNTTGTRNLFLGCSSGKDNLTGAGNTFVGSSAGAMAGGSFNVFIGDGSGNNYTTGDGNILIGREACNGFANGSGNILIGQMTSMGLVSNNRIGIGDQAFVALDDCAVIGNSFITKIGIGKTPSASNIFEFQVTTAKLTTGGVWTNASDRKLKDNIAQLDKKDILDKINQLEVARWHYKADEKPITHIGPFAKEFYAAFQTGDDSTISTIDPSGVALIGIQQLSVENDKLKAQIAELNNEMMEIKKLLEKKLSGNESQTGSQDKMKAGKLNHAVPNPAGTSTTFGYQITIPFRHAEILVTDHSGTMSLPINLNTASGEVNVNVSSFRQGYYQYSLIVDGVNIDSKHFSVIK